MNILYLSQLIPYPADAGPKVRIYRVLQHLMASGHRVTLVAFRRDIDTPEAIDHLRQAGITVHSVLMTRSVTRDAWELARSLVTNQSFMIGRDSVTVMHQLLQRLVVESHFDVIHADQLWMAQYGLAASTKNGAASTTRMVLDQHNAVFLIPKRLAAATTNPIKRLVLNNESRKLARFEVEVCRKFDRVVWVTEEDRLAINKMSNGQGSRLADPVIPICVDPQGDSQLTLQPGAKRVVFIGGMHWPPNAEGVIWFAREVWPLVVKQEPDARLTIIGKNPPATLSKLEVPNIELTGYVADPVPYLVESAAFIVPLHAGGGMRVKILDAWCWGLPVVSTAIGAEGLRYEHQKNLLIGEDVQEFAEAVVTLLRNPQKAQGIIAGGRKTVEEHYDWRKVYRAWDEVYSPAS